MPLAHHLDRDAKYRQQLLVARDTLIPFIEAVAPVDGRRVLEIGCGEGGILEAFLERGCRCVGMDLSPEKIEHAHKILHEPIAAGQADFVAANIYDDAFMAEHGGPYDIVLMKDTIEHIPNRRQLLNRIRSFLAPEGVLFIGFPPWYMPYGGHQQIAYSTPGKLPYYHLLPRPLYRRLLKAFGEPERRVEELMEIVDTRLTILQLERLLRQTRYETLRRELYLIRPIYRHKFGLTPRRQLPGLRSLPVLRDFVTTAAFYLVRPR